MRKQLLLSVILVVLSIALGTKAVAQATVSGIVVDVETNAPIVGATVAIQGANANAITDDKGSKTLS